jgi:hypothetical protein
MICPYCQKNEATVKLQSRHSESMACTECTAEQDEHECPFQCEINEDHEFTCTCSVVDEYECAMDI